VADPLGGSWYVEALTDELERQAEQIFARIREMGGDGTMTAGILRGIEDGWFTGEIAEAAFQYQQKLEKGDKKVVGVNTNLASDEPELEILRISGEVEKEQVRVLAGRKAGRDEGEVGPRWRRWSTPPGARPTWSRRCSRRPGWRPRWARSAGAAGRVGRLHRARPVLRG
jgi:methylmalonyl-CoA mutase N-terminal domain/subunit